MSALDRFFDHYYRRRPVNASFVGLREYDGVLPDFGEDAVRETISEMDALRLELTDTSVDEVLARNFLSIQLAEYRGDHFHRRNPAIYTGEAVFGLLTSRARLPAIPRLLDQAKQNIQSSPRPWVERAIRECDGALAILSAENTEGGLAARRAFEAFRDHLETAILPHADTRVACGREFLELLVSQGHMLEESIDQIAELAESELKRLAGVRPAEDRVMLSEDSYLDEHQACWEACREVVSRHDLLSWPDFPLRFTRIPERVRAGAPKLYYLSYRSPSPLALPEVHACEINRCGRITMKLNHVVHHAGPGHHVQNHYAYRSSSQVGRIAAVDCAYRIALFSGGTMAEGWACYATDLLEEFGFCDDAERQNQQHTRLRMAGRAYVDVRMHTGQMTFDEAETFYRDVISMSAANARNEATRNSMFPGTALMYLMGTRQIHELRRKLQGRMALKDFHDEFLRHGSIPVSMISRRMLSAVR